MARPCACPRSCCSLLLLVAVGEGIICCHSNSQAGVEHRRLEVLRNDFVERETSLRMGEIILTRDPEQVPG